MKHFDVHCHYFNMQYAFREALVIGWDMILGRYPRGGEGEKEGAVVSGDRLRGWSELLKYIASLAGAATRSCRNQYLFEQKQYRESALADGERAIPAVPLMMDIYYIFSRDDAGIEKPESEVDTGNNHFPLEKRKLFDAFAADLKRRVLEEVSLIGYDRIAALNRDYSALAIEEGVTSELQGAIDGFFVENSTAPSQKELRCWLSWGYRTHMRDLENLRANEPGTVMPFLAVDPRRQDIASLLEDKVGRDKPFKGVKIYPALGYLPTHPNLFPVYDFCSEHDVPICVHASPGGLPSLAGKIYVRSKGVEGRWFEWDLKASLHEPSRYFGAPKNWVPVLEAENGRYRNLRINFAHFGGDRLAAGTGDKQEPCEWRRQIIDLMENFAKVYADLSYCHNNYTPGEIRALVRQFPVLAERLMFGTDYIMIMTDMGLGGLRNYFDHFRGLPEKMFSENARSFLG